MKQKQKQITQIFTSDYHKLVITISPDSAQQCLSCNLLMDKIYQYANQLLKDPQFSNHIDQKEGFPKEQQEHDVEGFQQPPSTQGKQVKQEETHPNEQEEQIEEEQSQPKIPRYTPPNGKKNYEQDDQFIRKNQLYQDFIALQDEEQFLQDVFDSLQNDTFNRDQYSKKLSNQGPLVKEQSSLPHKEIEEESNLSHQQNKNRLKMIRYRLRQIMKQIGSQFCLQIGEIDQKLLQELRKETRMDDEDDLVAIERKLGILLNFCGSIASLNKHYSDIVEKRFRKSLSKGEFGLLLQLKNRMLKEVKEMLMISGAHLSK